MLLGLLETSWVQLWLLILSRGGINIYLRVRFGVDIRGALPKSTTLVINAAGKTVKFKYERMFSFCFWCGFLDHVVDDCVDFFEKGQRYEECGYDESLRGILPRPAYAPVPAFRASQVVPHPLLTYVALSRYGGKSSLNGTSGLVAPLGFLPLPQRPQPIQQAPLPSLLVSGSMLNSLGTTLGSVPTLAHPASTLAMAFFAEGEFDSAIWECGFDGFHGFLVVSVWRSDIFG